MTTNLISMSKEDIINQLQHYKIFEFEYGYYRFGKYQFHWSDGIYLEISIIHPSTQNVLKIYETTCILSDHYLYQGNWVKDLDENIFPHFEKLIEEKIIELKIIQDQRDSDKQKALETKLQEFNNLYV